MEATFRERWSTARRSGRRGALLLLLRTTMDLLVSGAAEHVSPTLPHHERHQGAPLMDWLRQDLRFAFRSLLRRPGFTAVTVATLALGVGANTAIFSVVNGVLLRPLPWPDQDRLITIWGTSEENPDQRGAMSRADLLDIAETRAFDAVIGYANGTVTMTGLGDAETVSAIRLTSGILEVFGLEPLLGRDLTLADTEPGSTHIVVLSHAFWSDRLGQRPDVIGTTIELGDEAYRVVGVAPQGFDYPSNTQMWRPYENDVVGCGRGCQTLTGLGRLSADVRLESAESEVHALAERLQEAHPDTNYHRVFELVTLEELTVGSVREGIWLLLGAVGLVLLIACANVANLMLARAQTRTGEVALRATLGATGTRLGLQVLMESVLLALAGGAVGLTLAFGGTALLRRIAAGTIPRIDEVGVDATVLAFTVAVALLVGLLFGLAPAVRVARLAPGQSLVHAGRGASITRADARSRGVLLTAEVALSLVLLTGAGLLLKSFARLYAVDPGYETEGILRFSLALPDTRYPDLASINGFFQALEARIAAVPGVEAVGSGFGPPLGGGDIGTTVYVEGRPHPAPEDETGASVRPVTGGFFETMRIPALRGRVIERSDDTSPLPVAVVNERFVRENFPNEEVLGRRINMPVDFDYGSPTWTIVGVVPDVMSRSLTAEPPSEIYVTHSHFGPVSLTVAVRTAEGAAPVLPAVQGIVRQLDADIPIRRIETMEEAVGRQLAPARFFLALVGLFAVLALVLAATGLYGVASFLASRRRREVGIRIALGAPRERVVRLMLGQGLRPALWGVALGLVGTWLASRSMKSLLVGVEPTDPLVYAGVALLLLGVVLVACLIPARAGSRVDPVEALRAE
jgi:predicted permease